MKKKILIVDDEPRIVRLLSMRLKRKDYEIFEAYDRLEGIKTAEKEVPDLIILNFKMPIMNGIAAFEEILKLEITKEIPVLFMTAYPKMKIENQVIQMGAKGCISKPFISEDFEQTIDMIIKKYDLSDYQ